MKPVTPVTHTSQNRGKERMVGEVLEVIMIAVSFLGLLFLGRVHAQVVAIPDNTVVETGKPDPELDSLIGMLSDSSPQVRWNAVYELTEKADPRALDALIALVDDPEPDVRFRVVSGLGRFSDNRVIAPLVYCLADDDAEIRYAAARSLGKVGGEGAVTALLLVVGDADPEMRTEAVAALGGIGDERAIKPLKQALGDKESYQVRKAAARALFIITGDRYQVTDDDLEYASDCGCF